MLKIGVPREVMDHELRVGMTPQGVDELVGAGCEVLVEAGAGLGSGFTDDDYRRAGATLVGGAEDVYGGAGLVVKVKEPLEKEYGMLGPGLAVFCFLHLAAHAGLAQVLLERGVTAVAYESVEAGGELPLLAPMSEVAGRMAPQIGAHYLESMNGGRGVLMGGAAGVAPAEVLILGAGMVGMNAAIVSTGMEAHVTVLDKDAKKLQHLEQVMHGRISTLMSNRMNIEEAALRADLVIGAVLVPGTLASHVLPEAVVKEMRPGAVFVDVAIDQGGCSETSCLTTHSEPVYTRHGVVHYCVGNIPAAVPRTSTFALTNVTLPWVELIAAVGVEEACRRSPGIREGVNIMHGAVTSQPVAESLGLAYTPLSEVLG